MKMFLVVAVVILAWVTLYSCSPPGCKCRVPAPDKQQGVQNEK